MLSRIAEDINKYTNSQIFRPSKDQESKWRHIKNTVLPVLHLLTVLICLICFAKLITKRGWIPFDCDHHPPPQQTRPAVSVTGKPGHREYDGSPLLDQHRFVNSKCIQCMAHRRVGLYELYSQSGFASCWALH